MTAPHTHCCSAFAHHTDTRPTGGMTLRDYMAAKAMQGYLASLASDLEPAEFATRIADDSYLIADAMLKARTKA